MESQPVVIWGQGLEAVEETGYKGTWGDLQVFDLIVVVVSQVYTNVKIYQIQVCAIYCMSVILQEAVINTQKSITL